MAAAKAKAAGARKCMREEKRKSERRQKAEPTRSQARADSRKERGRLVRGLQALLSKRHADEASALLLSLFLNRPLRPRQFLPIIFEILHYSWNPSSASRKASCLNFGLRRCATAQETARDT